MSAVNVATAAAPVLMPWMPGPVDPRDAPVVVSFTEFSAHYRRDLPGVAVKGARMRMGWYAMAGAVGMWLWMTAAGRGGSISVWETEADLERFIAEVYRMTDHVRLVPCRRHLFGLNQYLPAFRASAIE